MILQIGLSLLVGIWLQNSKEGRLSVTSVHSNDVSSKGHELYITFAKRPGSLYVISDINGSVVGQLCHLHGSVCRERFALQSRERRKFFRQNCCTHNTA